MDGLRICQELIVRPERHSFLLGANELSWPNEILLVINYTLSSSIQSHSSSSLLSLFKPLLVFLFTLTAESRKR